MRSERPEAYDHFLWGGVIVAAWVSIILLRSIPVAGTWKALSWETYAYVAACFVILTIGIWIGSRLGSQSRAAPEEAGRVDPAVMVVILSAVSLIGALIVIYEFAIVRGYGFSESVHVIRMLELARAQGDAGPSAFSGAGRLASAAIASAWVAYAIADFNVGRATLGLLIVATLVGFYCEAQFLGGRLMIAAIWTAVAFTYLAQTLYRIRRGKPWSLRAAVLLAVAGVGSSVYFVSVFAFRIRRTTGDPKNACTSFAEYFQGDLDVACESSSTVLTALRFVWVYATHGLNELQRLLQAADIPLAYGAVQFAKVAQALTVLTGQDWRYDTLVNVPNPALYWTLLGDMYVDFGQAGSIAAVAVFGFLLGWSATRLLAGSRGPLASTFPFLMTIGVFSPMLSLVQNLWSAVLWTFSVWSAVALFNHWMSRTIPSR